RTEQSEPKPTVLNILQMTDLPGLGQWIHGLARFHDRSRFRMSIATIGPRNDHHAMLEGFGVSTFALGATKRRHYPGAIVKLARVLRREQIDILQMHMFDPSAIGLLAAKLAGTGLTIVTRHHADFTTLYNRPIHRGIDRWQALTADHVMAASDAVKRAMMVYERVPEEKITVARYGYDFQSLHPHLSHDERVQLRDSLGGNSRYLIATISRLSIEKGHQYLFEALRQLVVDHPKLKLLLAGSGPMEAELKQQVSQMGLAAHVEFLGWRPDIHRVMEAMDLIVHPSLHEAFCNVIIEAMALERPLVATDVAGAPEQIVHLKSGLLIPPRDPAAIVAAVRELVADPTRAAGMGRAARQRVIENWNFPKMMREYEDCYQRWWNDKHLGAPQSTATEATAR
ncbi:MAG TPA: glycosyltransferase, partial [Pirellulales bacterium]|nr:glycosyltransferase [Pirellulales bacterium]